MTTHSTMDLSDRVRSLTVIPPWSLPVVLGDKPIENRTTNLAGSWRGRVLILSSKNKFEKWAAETIAVLTGRLAPTRAQCHPGYYIGAVTLTDVHRSTGKCCLPWGRTDAWHHVFTDAVAFSTPIKATGHLSLRRVTNTSLIATALDGAAPALPDQRGAETPRRTA